MRWWLPVLAAGCAARVPDEPPDTDPPATSIGADSADTDATTLSGTPATLALGEAVVCADPGARTTLGPLAPRESRGDWGQQPFDPLAETLFIGGGLTVADLDDDGRDDLVLTSLDRTRVYRQQADGSLVDTTDTAMPMTAERSTSVIPADVDADGDLDLFVTRHKRIDLLLENQGDGTFTEHPEGPSVAGDPRDPSVGASWADLDLDGDLDLFVAVYGTVGSERRGMPSRLYLQQPDGTFTDASETLPTEVQGAYPFVGAFVDLDDDHLPELYTVHDYGPRNPNALLHNRSDGLFEVDDGSAGLNFGIQGMGLAVDDLDGDGTIDLAVAGWLHHRLMRGHRGLWLDEHDTWGFDGVVSRGQHVAWGPHSGDLDNDGLLDLVLGFGAIHNQSTPASQPDELLLQGPVGTLTPVGQAWGFDHPGQTRAVLAVDVDGDGWLDLLRKDLQGPAILQPARCGEAAWLDVALRQPGGNARAIGAEVWVQHGDRVVRRFLRAGGTSIFAADPGRAHLGLGDLNGPVTLEIRWPDGARSTVHDVPTHRRVVVTRQPSGTD